MADFDDDIDLLLQEASELLGLDSDETVQFAAGVAEHFEPGAGEHTKTVLNNRKNAPTPAGTEDTEKKDKEEEEEEVSLLQVLKMLLALLLGQGPQQEETEQNAKKKRPVINPQELVQTAHGVWLEIQQQRTAGTKAENGTEKTVAAEAALVQASKEAAKAEPPAESVTPPTRQQEEAETAAEITEDLTEELAETPPTTEKTVVAEENPAEEDRAEIEEAATVEPPAESVTPPPARQKEDVETTAEIEEERRPDTKPSTDETRQTEETDTEEADTPVARTAQIEQQGKPLAGTEGTASRVSGKLDAGGAHAEAGSQDTLTTAYQERVGDEIGGSMATAETSPTDVPEDDLVAEQRESVAISKRATDSHGISEGEMRAAAEERTAEAATVEAEEVDETANTSRPSR